MAWCSGTASCVDCNKIFDLTSIKAHTSCISETDKYAGKWLAKKAAEGPKPKPAKPSGPFVPAISFDDSDSDSDIEMPKQSPISAPKQALVVPTVFNLVYANDTRNTKEKIPEAHDANHTVGCVPTGAPAEKEKKQKKEKKDKKAKTDKKESAADPAEKAALEKAAKKADKKRAREEAAAAEAAAAASAEAKATKKAKKEKKEKKDKVNGSA